MGCNYYIIRNIDIKNFKDTVFEKLNKNDFSGLLKMIPKRIHIGKNTLGWEFLWNHQNWDYFHNDNSLKDFLQDGIIYDEYDREIPYGDFKEIVKPLESDKDFNVMTSINQEGDFQPQQILVNVRTIIK